MEGVTQARVEAHRLRLMVDRALALVETSPARDHLWQVGGDLILGLPERMSDLERSLDRTSYALVVMGEDFLRGRIPIDDRYVVDEATKTHPYSGPRMKEDAQATRVAGRYLAARVARRYLASLDEGILLAQPEVPTASAEHHFFDNPKKRETREFAQSNALSNLPGVAGRAVKDMDNPQQTVGQAKADARKAPPTPGDILDEPGGKQFSTLNRQVIETAQPDTKGVPTHRDDLPKAQKPKGNL